MLACRLAVLPRAADGALDRRSRAVLCGALALLTLASFGILLSRTLELNGGVWSSLLQDARLALAMTHFGHVWLWRLPALALLWLAWVWTRHRPSHTRVTGWLMLVAVAAMALTRSETGHPADHGDFTLAVWIDWAHLLAAATWVGSLFGMSLVVFPRLLRARDHSPARDAEIFQRLSTLSGAALLVLLACGIYNVSWQLGPVSSLWTTRYGIVLDIKLAIVLVMIVIGAHNRYVKLPRLLMRAGRPVHPSRIAGWLLRREGAPTYVPPDPLKSCARAVLVESLLGLAVIGATATLIHAMPPTDARSMHSLASASISPAHAHQPPATGRPTTAR